jgi:hypothetical protein
VPALGHKGVKEARFDLLPMDALWMVARVFGKGAEKYAERNWERGLKWGASKGALDRHLALFWAGENYDEESGLPHLAHVAWHGLVLLAMFLREDGEDDRSIAESFRSMTADVTNPQDIEDARAEAQERQPVDLRPPIIRRLELRGGMSGSDDYRP